MKDSPTNSQTAYATNLSPDTLVSENNDFGWCHQINAMLKNGYSFLPSCYEQQGFLFRGMSHGLSQALEDDRFWHFSDQRSVTQLETELDVAFVSQDFSDAYGVARLWEESHDSGVLVMASQHFNQQLLMRQAAMLAFAEPGVVFRYPFLCLPLLVEDLAFIVVADPALRDKLSQRLIDKGQHSTQVLCPAEDGTASLTRTELETVLLNCLQEQHVQGAALCQTDEIPQRN